MTFEYSMNFNKNKTFRDFARSVRKKSKITENILIYFFKGPF